MPVATVVHLTVVPESDRKWWSITIAISFAHGETVSSSECDRIARLVAKDFVDARDASFVRADKERGDGDTHVYYDVWGPPRDDALRRLAEGRWEERAIEAARPLRWSD